MIGLDARPGPAAARLDLAALHRERDVVSSRVAGDQAQLGAEDAVHHLWEEIGVGAGAGAADEHRPHVQILEARDAAFAPGGADAHFVVGAAEPAELAGVELRTLGAE